jgi:hypothetical protein
MNPRDLASRDKHFEEFLAAREEILPSIREYSPYAHASADDPPVFLSFWNPPNFGEEQKDPTHSANFGVGLKRKLDELGVPCELVYPGGPDGEHESVDDFLIEQLSTTKE